MNSFYTVNRFKQFKAVNLKDIPNFIEILVLDVSILPKTCEELYFFIQKIYIYMELRVS